MHRIDDPTAVPTLPAPRVQGTPGYFTGGSPGSSGFAATVVRYEFMNALQEEISHVIETAGMALDKTDNGQLLIAMRRIFLARIVLTAPLTIFVNPVTGNDSNNGLTPTTAFLTIQAAVNAVYRNYDFNGYPCAIQLADGDYNYTLTGGVAVQFFGMPFGCGVGAFSLVGNYQNPSAVRINATNGNCIAVFNANINIKGLSLSATGNVSTVYQTQGLGLTVNGAGWCDVQYCQFRDCGQGQIAASNGSVVTLQGTANSFTGATQFAMSHTTGGQIWFPGATLNVTGLSTVVGFVWASKAGVISGYGASFIGSATGPRYNVQLNGVIVTNGAGANYFPGDAPGFAATGGQYA